jgi:hypothetical protein
MGRLRAYSPATLAERWTCSAQLVRQMIKRGELEGFYFGKMLRISAAAVARHEAGGKWDQGDEKLMMARPRRRW